MIGCGGGFRSVDSAPIAGAGGPVGSGEHGISHGEALLQFRWQNRRSGLDRIQIFCRAEVVQWGADRGAGGSGTFAVRLGDAIEGGIAQF